jgi:DNA-binding CsgD family transcriptional regulator
VVEALLALPRPSAAGSQLPTALFLDDLDIVDGADIDWLVSLRRTTVNRVVVVGAGRGLPDRLLAASDFVIDMRPLTDAASIQRARERLGGDPGPLLTRRIKSAGGVPAAIVELIQCALDDDALAPTSEGIIDLCTDLLPASMMGRSSRRLARLGADVQSLGFAAAVLGRRVDLAVAAEVANPIGGSLTAKSSSSFDKLIRSGMLIIRGDQVEWAHELVRESVVLGIPTMVRADVERRACLVLSRQGACGSDVLDHLERSNATDAERRSVLEAASQHPDLEVQVRALQLLAQQEPPGSPARESLLEELCRAAEHAGVPATLHWAAGEIISRHPEDGRAWQHLVFSLMAENRMAEAAESAAAALEVLRDPVQRAPLVASMALAEMTSMSAAMHAKLDEAARIANQTQDPEARVAIGSVRSRIAAHRFDAAQALLDSSDAVAAAASSPSPQLLRYQPHFFAALAQFEAGEVERAQATLLDGKGLAEKFGFVWAASTLAACAAVVAASMGDDIEAEQAALDAIGLGRISNSLPTALPAFAVLARIRLQAGEEAVCAALLDEADQLVAAGGKFGLEHVIGVRMDLLQHLGRKDEALEMGRQVFDLFVALGIGPAAVEMAPMIVGLALACDATSVVQHVAAQLQELVPSHAPVVACTVRDWAVCCAENDWAGARVALYALPEWCVSLQERLVAPLPPEPPERLVSSAGNLVGQALTATEQLVATKLADGCSNREIAALCFMSVRTAEHHVARINKKLGVRSRIQAIAHLSSAPLSSPHLSSP